MASHHLTLTDSSERPLLLRRRSDLTAERHTYLGRDYWVVKDPLNLTFYRFEEEEFSLLHMLDGKTSPAEIQRRFLREFAPQRLTLAELQGFVSRLFQSSLVVADAPAQGEQLWQRRQQRRRRQRQEAWSNVLCIRFGGMNPDSLLRVLSRHCGGLFSWPGLIASLILLATALLLVTTEFDAFLRRLPDFRQFFAAENWLLLLGVLAGTKIAHELGHGTACRRFGGECHEMGLMLLIFTPCLYCNVSDSWMVRNKWHRAAIGAAGMYVELLLASLATIVWWFSEVGFIHYLCLDIMFVCSVSTILFNANPLLRYDGYFILADLLEIPNLRHKASLVVQRTLSRCLLGLTPPDDPFLPQRRRWLFLTYAIAASIYRWIVLVSILWFLYGVLKPQGLQVVGQLLMVISLYGLLVLPLWQFVRFLCVPGRIHRVKKLRLTAALVLMVAALATALATPLPYYVTCDFHIQPREAVAAYVDIPGTLVEIHVQEGQYVQAGQPLIRLENVDIELLTEHLLSEREQLVARLAALQLQAYDNDAALLEATEIQQSIASLEQRIERRQRDRERLTIRAACEGFVFPAAAIEPHEDPERLPSWSGHPLETRNRTAYLQEGVRVCQIGDPGRLEAVLAIDEVSIPSLEVGQSATLFPCVWRGRSVTGRIAQISHTDLHVTPTGYAAVTTRGRHDRRRPASNGSQVRTGSPYLSSTYQVNVPLDATDQKLLPGNKGRARIRAGSRTCARRLWESLCRTFRLEL